MKILILLILSFFPFVAQAQDKVGASLRYTICKAPDESNQCFIAFHKMRSMKNPMTGKLFFDNGLHFTETGQLFMYPTYAYAEPDLDGDGFKELIIVPKEAYKEEGMFCKTPDLCPHFILQDRNIAGQKPSLKNFKVLGAVYTYGIGLSTDEMIGGYRSLRAYTNQEITKYDVHQYDRKSDQYFNISIKE